MLVERVPDAVRMRDHWWWRPDWQPGSRHLHWYLTFEDAAPLHDLVDAVQKTLAPFPGLEPVERPWLHLTLARVGDSDEVSEACVRDVINATHAHLLDLPDLVLSIRRTVVFAESVVLMPDESPALRSLQAAVTTATGEVLGREVPEVSFAPHLSTAYACDDLDSTPVLQALADAPLTDVPDIRPSLSLVEVLRQDRAYTWRLVSAFPL